MNGLEESMVEYELQFAPKHRMGSAKTATEAQRKALGLGSAQTALTPPPQPKRQYMQRAALGLSPHARSRR